MKATCCSLSQPRCLDGVQEWPRPAFPSKMAKSLLLSPTLSSSPPLIPNRPRSQIPGHYSPVAIPGSLPEQSWSQEGERTLARWQTWCLVTAEALDPVSLSRWAWVAWATGCHEPAWPICAKQGEPIGTVGSWGASGSVLYFYIPMISHVVF